MLVSAFAGYEHTMAAYDLAVREKYRFFSFGDAMLIVTDADTQSRNGCGAAAIPAGCPAGGTVDCAAL